MAPHPRREKKARRVTVSGTVPVDRVDEIDTAADRLGITPSQFVAEAAIARAEAVNGGRRDITPVRAIA